MSNLNDVTGEQHAAVLTTLQQIPLASLFEPSMATGTYYFRGVGITRGHPAFKIIDAALGGKEGPQAPREYPEGREA